MSPKIDIDELRVGLFVHLDLGWWAHPFALSSFLIQSPDQITTIRGLGLKQVRWSPEKSLPEDAVPPAAARPAGQTAANDPNPTTAALTPDAAAADDAPPADTAAATDAVAASTHTTPPAAPVAQPLSPTPPAPTPLAATRTPRPDAAARQHRAALAAQREAQRLCEQQYGEAGAACRAAFAQVQDEPAQAREIGEGLTRALLDKLLVDGEMCVRTLDQGAGDSASAHALNVAVIALLMGRVFGLGEAEMLDLGVGALMHDIGKLELPERARHPEQPMSPAEQALYRDHVAHGVVHGRRMGLSEGAIAVLTQHHELADGSGFPQQLLNDRLSPAARIVALVNRYDNLCNPLQAAQGMTPHEALSLMFAQCRNKFDSAMLNAFIRMMGVYPPGSLVQLTDDRYATVIGVNSSRPLKPRVLVAELSVPVADALLLNLDQCPELGIRRSIKAGALPAAVRDYLSPRPRMVYFFEPVAAALPDADEVMAA
jgi:putative nucleotidyltransferase with HDIG domain